MPKVHPQFHAVIHELGPHDIVHRGAVLHPVHQRRQHVVGRRKGHARRRRPAALAHDPAPRARVAVEHARDAEEAEEGIQRVGRCGRPARQVVVEAFGVVAGDLVVLTAVVEEHLAAPVAEPAEAVGPGADVGGVEGLGFGGVVDVEGGRVPGGVVNDVFEPALKGGNVSEGVGTSLGMFVTSE